MGKITNVLIMGGGEAAERYVESLIWDEGISVSLCGFSIYNKTQQISRYYNLPYLSYNMIDDVIIQKYDCIIFALPVEVKRRYIQEIVDKFNYNGAIIIEKPLAINNDDLAYYIQRLPLLEKCAIVCQRDYDLCTYKLPNEDNLKISFSSVFADMKFNTIHMLPHILSLLMVSGRQITHLKSDGDNHWVGSIVNGGVELLVEQGLNGQLRVNNVLLPSVQYRILNSIIVKNVCNACKGDIYTNIKRAITVSQCVISLIDKGEFKIS